MRYWNLTCGFSVLICLVSIGCGDSGPPIGQVTGKVTLDDKPLLNAVVTFSPDGGGTSSTAKTNADGQFELIYLDRKGAVVGKHTVSVQIVADAPEIKPIRSDDPNYDKVAADTNYNKPAPPKLPAKYNTKSELKHEVKAGSNVIDLPLKSS